METGIFGVTSGWIMLLGSAYAPGHESIAVLIGSALCIGSAIVLSIQPEGRERK